MNVPMTKHEAIATRDVAALTHHLRSELIRHRDNIPKNLRQLKGWLLWSVTEISTAKKFNKIPTYPYGGRRQGKQGGPEDRQHLGTFDEVWTAFMKSTASAGIGLAMLPDWRVVAFDADCCIVDGAIRPDVAALVDDTYAERSPSGSGIRAFWRGTAGNGRNISAGLELYAEKQFVTVTGEQVENTFSLICGDIPPLSDELRDRLESLCTSTRSANPSRLAKLATDDAVLIRLHECGMVERDMGGGKFSVRCPFEDEHSDPGRTPGDGDTAYFLPNTGGYARGHFHCTHAHCAGRASADFLRAIGFDPVALEFVEIGEWSAPRPLPNALPPVESLDPALLPTALRPWITDIAERMQIPPDMPAVGAITALSAAIGRRIQIRPKRLDSWTVTPNLWGLVVAPPGYMKSPALSEVMKPLRRLERDSAREHAEAIAVWAMEKERVAIANAALRETAKKAIKHNPDADIPHFRTEPDQPIARRYCVNNFSLEALGEVLIGNPYGILAFDDEIHGLLKMADKPGNEGLHDFLLQGWNGDASYTFDRIGRGLGRRIEAVCMSVLGGIQPGRLMEYLSGAARGGSGDSGLVQRFQLLTWPEVSEEWKLVDREPNYEAQEQAWRVFEGIVNAGDFARLDGASECECAPQIRQFSSDAQDCFYSWLEALETEVRKEGSDLPDVMRSHLAKFRSLVPSLALVFSVADGVGGEIPLSHLKQAIGWANYLRSHAERAYAYVSRPAIRHARALLGRIKCGDLEGPFVARDVHRHGWTLLDRDGTMKAVEMLCDFDYLRAVESRPPTGRPTTIYQVNPMVTA